jgi:hypothetical protein
MKVPPCGGNNSRPAGTGFNNHQYFMRARYILDSSSEVDLYVAIANRT